MVDLKQYLENNKEEVREFHTIITQFGFTVTFKFGHNNVSIDLDFLDSETKELLFMIQVDSYNEALNLIALFSYLVEIDI